MRIKKSSLLCGCVLILQLLWLQKKVFFPDLSGIAYQIIYYMKYFGTAILVVYTLSKQRDCKYSDIQRKYISTFMPLFGLFMLIEVVTTVGGTPLDTYGLSYCTRLVAYILDKVCVLVEVSCIYLLCRENTIKCVTSALLVNGLSLIFICIMRTGLSATLSVFLQLFGLDTTTSLLEVHELTYCIGLLIIYYLFFNRSGKRRYFLTILLLIIVFWSGNKRIGFAGILFAGVFSLLVHRKGLSRRLLVTVGLTGAFVSVVYVSLLYNGGFLNLVAQYGINIMGRDSIYSYFINRTEFSGTFLGWGLAGVSKVIEGMTKAEVGNMYTARGLHNDILKIYIECGFIGSIAWYLFQLVYIPINILKKFGRHKSTLYMALAIFAFMTYLTDNTENYFVFQVLLFLLPLASVIPKEMEVVLYGEDK